MSLRGLLKEGRGNLTVPICVNEYAVTDSPDFVRFAMAFDEDSLPQKCDDFLSFHIRIL